MTDVEAIAQLAKCMDLADVVDLFEDERDATRKARIVFKELNLRGILLVNALDPRDPWLVRPRVRPRARLKEPEVVPPGAIRFMDGGDTAE